LQVASQGPADEPGRVRVFDQARDARFRAGDADAQRSALAQLLFGLLDQPGNRRECAGIVATGRGCNTAPSSARAMISILVPPKSIPRRKSIPRQTRVLWREDGGGARRQVRVRFSRGHDAV
jgi:hypothetical protein